MTENEKTKVSTRSGEDSRKIEKIILYLESELSGATPKMIALATSLNVNTIKSILPKIKNIEKFTRGWYKVVNRGIAPPKFTLQDWTFHNLIMTHSIKNYSGPTFYYESDLDLIKIHLSIGKDGLASLRVSSNPPINVNSIVVVQAYFGLLLKGHTAEPVTKDNTWISRIEFNKDYNDIRMEGIKCITIDTLLTHFKLYQKKSCLRKEYKTKHKFTTQTMIDMLTQNPTDLNLAQKVEEQQQQLNRLVTNSYTSNQLVMKLISKLEKRT